MTEENREDLPEPNGETTNTSDELAAALESATAASPALAEAIKAAGVSPDDLANAHERARPQDTDAES